VALTARSMEVAYAHDPSELSRAQAMPKRGSVAPDRSKGLLATSGLQADDAVIAR
jgi:hypothetical protein